jgi:16S rRNA (cytosine1402-N4)-methyltransferase
MPFGALGVNSSRSDAEPISHHPVLLEEALRLLAPPRGGTVVDCTVGLGGHARRLLEAVGPSGKVLGLDRDPESLRRARENLREFAGSFVPVRSDFRELARVLAGLGIAAVDALLADLGVSSFQIDSPARGFSFAADGPLDMRMDPSSGPTAADLVARLGEAELARLLRDFGEERAARRIARAIVRGRQREPIRGTRELARIVERAAPGSARRRIHPATRTFLALRIAVNRELEGLGEFVVEACRALRPGGRAAFIAFHSLEDREVKRALVSLLPRCTCPPDFPRCECGRRGLVERVTRKAVRPGPEEIRANPRSRSARLRVVRRLPDPPADADHRKEVFV